MYVALVPTLIPAGSSSPANSTSLAFPASIETAKYGCSCLGVLQWLKTVEWIYHNINGIKLTCIPKKIGSYLLCGHEGITPRFDDANQYSDF